MHYSFEALWSAQIYSTPGFILLPWGMLGAFFPPTVRPKWKEGIRFSMPHSKNQSQLFHVLPKLCNLDFVNIYCSIHLDRRPRKKIQKLQIESTTYRDKIVGFMRLRNLIWENLKSGIRFIEIEFSFLLLSLGDRWSFTWPTPILYSFTAQLLDSNRFEKSRVSNLICSITPWC